jgi:hypothetical protein
MDKTDLRDWIAMHALQGILASQSNAQGQHGQHGQHGQNITTAEIARLAYEIADRALEARRIHS